MTDTPHLERLAAAMWKASPPGDDSFPLWNDLPEKATKAAYRAMAQAALDALQLTEEWGVVYEGEKIPDEVFDDFEEAWAESNDHCMSCDSCRNSLPKRVVSRLVSPWVVVEEQKK